MSRRVVLAIDVCEHVGAHYRPCGSLGELYFDGAASGRAPTSRCCTCGHVCRITELNFGADPAGLVRSAANKARDEAALLRHIGGDAPEKVAGDYEADENLLREIAAALKPGTPDTGREAGEDVTP